MVRIAHFLAGLLAAASPARQGEIPKPEAVFGFAPGTDGKLVPYQQIEAYLRSLAEASPWIRVENLGRTTLGLTQVMAVISTPENLAKTARWQEIQRRLSDPRITSRDEAALLVEEGKVVVLVTCGIHSDEVASTQMAVELAYDLTANVNLPFDRDKLFENLILLLVPSVNPDGQEMVADWVARTAGTESEGAPMPRLYHEFAGHDNNRDWFAFNLAETRNISNVLYRTWRPQILVDHHQMGQRGARFFAPPFGDPLNRAVHPLVWRGNNLIGQAMAFALESAGKAGATHDSYFQGFWQGGISRAPWWHHGIGVLTETAGCNLAFPVTLEKGELEPGVGLPTLTEPLARHPNPWLGGTWRMRDIMDYQRIATFATLKEAAVKKTEWMRNVYTMAVEDLTAAESDWSCFRVPGRQRDPAARDRMIQMLQLAGVDVVSGPSHGGSDVAGDAVIPLRQPFARYAIDMLTPQRYPEIPGAARPYDITGWSLPEMMGVRVERVHEPPAGNVPLTPYAPIRAKLPERRSPSGTLAISAGSNDAFRAAMRVLAEQKPVFRVRAAGAAQAPKLEPGTFLVSVGDVPADGGWLTSGLALSIDVLDATLPIECATGVRAPRIGIYEAYDPSMDKGWTRFLVDKYLWRPQMIHHTDLEVVLDRLDTLVIPESPPEILWNGGPKCDPKLSRVPFPKEYWGGIGADGVKRLRAFVERGGCLVALGTSCDFLIERMELPVVNVLKGVKREEFYCPGSLLQLEVDANSPVGFGMDPKAVGFFASNVAFRTSPPNIQFDRKTIARFPNDGELLVSGHLVGGEKLRGLSAVVDLTLGKGHIVLCGIRVQHRAQTDATFKLLFNAILLPCYEGS